MSKNIIYMKKKIENKKNSLDFNKNVSLLVVSCDAYKDLWKPYFKSLFKYWPDCPYPVYLGSNKSEYSDSRVNGILIGQDKDYSSNLIAMLHRVESPWVILWIEDLLISRRIDTEYISKLVNNAQENNVGYLKLATSTPWVFTKNKEQLMGAIPKGVKYRSGIGLALWNKETLLNLLVPGESAWEIERNGSHRSNSFVEPFYALTPNVRSNPPITVINSVIKGKWNPDVLTFLKKEGLDDHIPNRKNQPLWSYLYGKAYLFRLDLYRIMRKYWYA